MHVRSQLSLVLLALALFAASSVSAQESTESAKEPTKPAKESTKDKASRERSGCICVRFMYADLGETQVYYAHEYDECLEELCPFPNVVYYTGTVTDPDQICPYECMSKEGLRESERLTEQPKLSAAKPRDFNIHEDWDPDVQLNPHVRKDDLDYFERWMPIPDQNGDGDEELIPIKIFVTRVHGASITAVATFGVEVTNVGADARRIRSDRVHLVDGYTHLYRVDLTGHHYCLVLIADQAP
jgi:hypothetical protein